MPKKVRRVNARSTVAFTRRVLVTKSEGSPHVDQYDEARHAVQLGFAALRQSIAEIRSIGLGIADLRPQLESRTVEVSTPRTALTAFAASGSTVADARLTIHVEQFANDLDDTVLLELQISHIIGVHAKSQAKAVWTCSHADGLIATVTVRTAEVARLVHDVLLDIAMARASHATWTGIRDTLTSRQLAARKLTFSKREGLLSSFTYGRLNGENYAPLSSLLPRSGGVIALTDALVQRYINLWEKLGAYCKNSHTGGTPLSMDAALNLAGQIIRQHKHGGQISIARLAEALSRLPPGAYRLYFLIHRGATPVARARIGALFHKSPAHLHTQIWIIHTEGSRDADAKYLIDRNWVVYYPFQIGGPQ